MMWKSSRSLIIAAIRRRGNRESDSGGPGCHFAGCSLNWRSRVLFTGVKMNPQRAQSLLRQYNLGNITGHELLNGLIDAAASQSPEQLVQLIPEERLRELRDVSAIPPGSPDAVRSFRLSTWIVPPREQ